MFTLIKNYKALLMMCVANSLEGPQAGAVDAAIQDNEINLTDIDALSQIPEAQEAILERMEGELSLAGDIASTLGDITPDSARDNPTMNQQKTIQFIMNLYFRASGEEGNVIGVDGRIGRGTKRALSSIISDYDGGVITQSQISLLIQKTNTRLSNRIQEARAAREARETRETAAKELLASYNTIEEVRAGDVVAVQEALNTLGHNVGTADGIAGNRTETGFNAYVEAREETTVVGGVSEAETNLEAAREREAETNLAAEASAAELVAANADLIRERAEIAEAREALRGKTEALEAARELLGGTNSLLTEANRGLEEMEGLLATAEATAEREGTERLDAAREVGQTRLALEGEQRALDAARAALSQVETALEAEEAALAQVMETQRREQGEAEAAIAALSGYQDRVNSANTEVETSNAEVSTRNERLVTAREDLATANVNLTAATGIRERVQARIADIEYSDMDVTAADVANITIQQARADFNAAEEAYGRAQEDGEFIDRIENTTWNNWSSNDNNYFEAAIVLALVEEREAQAAVAAAETVVTAAETAHSEAEAIARTAQRELEAATLALEVAQATSGRESREAEAAMTALRAALTDVREAGTEVTESQTRVSELETAVGEAEAAIGEAEAAHATEVRQSELIDAEVARLRDRIIEFRGEIGRLEGVISNLDDNTIPALIAQLEALEAGLATAEAELSAAIVGVTEAETVDESARVHAAHADRELTEAEAALVEAEEDLEILNLERSIESDVYSRIDIEGEITAESIKEALLADPEGRELICQLQADLKILTDQDGNPLYRSSIDGSFGPGTTRAVEAALAEYGSLIAIRRAARLAEVRAEAEANTGEGRTNRGIDIVAGIEEGSLEAFLAEYTVTADMPDELRIQPGMHSPEERTELLERQRSWVIEQAIMMGDRENADGTRTTFIDGLAQYGNDSLRDVTAELRRNFESAAGRQELADAMFNGQALSPQDFVNSRGVITIGQTQINANLLDSAYIATGSDLTTDVDGSRQRGTMEVPIWNPDGTLNEHFAELDFENATYINGAIVMTMKNGCEGNLVIIPVQREKYVPPVVVQRPEPQPQPQDPEQPEDPQDPENPETGRRCRTDRKCENGYIWVRQICWDVGSWGFGNPTYSPWEQTNETCGGEGDPGGDPNGGGDTSDPGHDGGGDVGGGGTGGTGGTGRGG